MKKIQAVLAAAVIALTAPAMCVYALELNDYSYDEEDWSFDSSYENYYENGVVYDDSGVVHINGGKVKMSVGETKDLSEDRKYHSLDRDLEIRIVGGLQWDSDDPVVASVNSKGIVTAHKAGSTRITVSFYDNRAYRVTQTIRLTVSSGDESTKVAKDKNYFEIAVGKRIYLGDLPPDGVGDVTWKSGDDTVASVTQEGLVKARSIGNCKVTATYTGKDGSAQTADFSVRVSTFGESTGFRVIRITVPKGKKIDVVKLFYPDYNGGPLKKIKCFSSDTSIASLRGYEAHALKKGSCTVTISDYDDYDVRENQRITVRVTN